MNKKILLILIIFSAQIAHAQKDITGLWKTIDDNTGKPRSIVEIYKNGNKYFGKVKKLYRDPGEDPNPMCDECDEDDDRYKKPVIGMEIIRDLEKDGDEYDEGTVLDPENGSVYRCKIWLEDGNLMLRGYIAFFFRTQTWLPYVEEN